MAPMKPNHRSHLDRRSGEDRRQTYSIDYFLEGGEERRDAGGRDRRNKEPERRSAWVKITRWSSVFIDS